MVTWDQLKFLNSDEFYDICRQLQMDRDRGYSVLPADEDILNAFYYTPFHQVKVVILGQDPYPNSDHAHGLAFSVPEEVTKFPPSLKNIFKELQDDIDCLEPTVGSLVPWAQQGVLLLNTSLTVLEGSIGSHATLGWMRLVNEAIHALSENRDNLVFILWGAKAKTKATFINKKRHLVITGAHPSPLAANRGGFFGTNPFSTTNEYLKKNGIEQIEWCLP